MPTQEDVRAAVEAGVDAIDLKLDGVAERVSRKLGDLTLEIGALKQQLADLGTPADFTGVLAKLAAVQAEADAIAADPAAAPVETV